DHHRAADRCIASARDRSHRRISCYSGGRDRIEEPTRSRSILISNRPQQDAPPLSPSWRPTDPRYQLQEQRGTAAISRCTALRVSRTLQTFGEARTVSLARRCYPAIFSDRTRSIERSSVPVPRARHYRLAELRKKL